MESQFEPLIQSRDETTTPVFHQRYHSINAPGPQFYGPSPLHSPVPPDIKVEPEVVVEHELKMKLYKRRWYVLLIYSLFAATQGAVWNTWGPISTSAEKAFGWEDWGIDLLANWGPIAYVVGAVFFSWMVDVKGLRWACLSSILLVAAGCGLRCITSTPPAATWLINIGQFLNGLAAPMAMGAPPVVSAVWFPPDQRTTSTAISFAIDVFGVALSFIIGPLLVPEPPNSTARNNQSDSLMYSEGQPLQSEFYLGDLSNSSDAVVSKERKDIMFLMYLEFGWSVLILILLLIYFPKKPPLPPCISASQRRESFWKGLKDLFKRKQFWLIAFAYGLSLGVANCWSSILDVILRPHNISQNEAGWIGFYATLSGCIASLVVARFADIFSKHMKWFILCLYIVGGGFFAWFALACVNIGPATTAVMYVTVIVGITSLNASVPLIYELACELTYPIGEGTTNGVLTLINNVGGLIFLFVTMIKSLGKEWVNWAMMGSVIVCLPVLLLLKERYNRLQVDETDLKHS